MMDRGLTLSSHDHRQLDPQQRQPQQQQQRPYDTQQQQQQQQQQQPYDTQPSPIPRSQLSSRATSYSAPAQNPYTAQTNENVLSNTMLRPHKDPAAYVGLGISAQSADSAQSLVLPSPDSPFTAHPMVSRYSGQPPTPSFPTLGSSSPASSVWSASDHGTTSNLSGFIPRLHKMVSDEKYQALISWNGTGTSFYISHVSEFAATVLPLHFKHNNFSSFVRQLNMYGFHKVNKTPRGYKVAAENQVWEFSHTKFIRHRPDLLDEIKRRQGDIDYVREGDLSTHLSLMQVQQNDIMKQLNALQEQLGGLVNGLHETQQRQASLEERLKMVLEYLEKQQPMQSPASSQGSVKPPQTIQRKQSMQKTPGRRPSHVSRLVLDEKDRRYSNPTSQDMDSFFEPDPMQTLGTPPQSSPPASQPSSSGSGRPSPGTSKVLRSAMSFSTPSGVNTPASQYTPASSFSSVSSQQRNQPSPTLRRNKSMIMPHLTSPSITPAPSYNFPAQYTPSLSTIETSQVLQQDVRPHSSDVVQQSAQPPATYQSAAAPYATPPRLSNLSQSQYTPHFQTPGRQEQYITETLQLGSPASFASPGGIHSLAQQIQRQRRRQDSDCTEDMDLGN